MEENKTLNDVDVETSCEKLTKKVDPINASDILGGQYLSRTGKRFRTN